MKKVYKLVLKFLKPFIVFCGSIYMPFTRKKVTGKHYYILRDKIKTGTVLLSTTRGEFSNLINPEKIKHAALYVGDLDSSGIKYVIEAVGKGVVKPDLITFLTTKDLVIGCKPNFLTSIDEAQLPIEAKRIIGIPYDYLFEKDTKAFYCFEAVAHVFKMIRPELRLKTKEIIKGKEIFSYETYLNDKEFFEIVFESDKV